MSINIADEVQKRLSLPPFEKVSPDGSSENTQGRALSYPVVQGCVVAALTGLYKLTRTTNGCEKLISTHNPGKLLTDIYGDHFPELIDHLATYNGRSANRKLCEHIVKDAAETAILVMDEEIASPTDTEAIKNFMSGQRDNILVYLPEKLQLGKMLNDNMLDDNTNKMEGPVSSLMHKIENIFSEGN